MPTPRLMALLFGALGLLCQFSAGADPWTAAPFSLGPAELLAATAGPPSDGEADAEAFQHELRYELDAEGKKTATRRMVYKILTAEGIESWAQIEESYLPWYQETPRFRARVVTPDGKSRELDPKTIADSPAAQEPELLDDERVLRAPLPAITVGAVVELEVVLVDRRPFFATGTVTRAALDLGIPVRHARVTIEAPRALPLRHRLEGLPGVSARLAGDGERQRVEVEVRDLPGGWPWWFPDLPPEVPRGPAVSFSTGASWSAIAEAYSRIVDQQVAAPDLGGFDQLASPAASQQEEIRLLLDKVHREVRYTGVELGDAGLVPRTPKDTVERRFGDCKDKAALVVALLRDRGIPAYLALLNAGRGQDVARELPGIGLFNHAIVYVPGTPALWIDATDPLSRLGQLPAADQGRLALVASPTTRDLVVTPVASAEENRAVEHREIELPLFGNGRVRETSELHGELARELRAAWLDQGADDIAPGLENYVRQNYQAQKLVSHEVTDSRDLSRPMTTRLEAAEVELATVDADQGIAVILLGPLFEGLPDAVLAPADEEEDDEARPRTVDWALAHRFRREWNYRIRVPSNLEPRELPKDETVTLGPGVLRQEFRSEPGLVTARIEFTIDRDRLTPAEADTLRAEIAKLKNVGVWFDQKIARALQAGDLATALAEAGRLEKEFPDRAFPSMQRSRALLAAGFGEEAQKAALRATEIEPTSPAAFHQLGWTRQHDALARRLESGHYDRAGAIAAFEKAIELEPGNAAWLAELAIQLEFDGDGNRYTTSAEDLGRAISLYETIFDELENKNLATNLLIALGRAGRWQDLLTRAEKVPKSDTVAIWQVAAKAALEGADAAILDAGRRITDTTKRAAALGLAADLLLRERRYPDAAKLLNATSRLANDQEALGRAELFGRAKVQEWGKLERPRAPEDTFWMVFALVFTPEVDLDRLMPFLTPALRSRPILEEQREEFRLLHAKLMKTSEAQDLPLTVMADILRVAAEPNLEPDPSGEVKVSARLSPDDDPLVVYAVPAQDGGYDILPADLSSLGFEARWQAEQGNLEAARRYLDHALEFVTPSHPKDPLSGSPFAMIWKLRREAEVDGLRLAGAVGAVLTEDSKPDPRDLEALEGLRSLARTPDEQVAVAWALAEAHHRRDEATEAVDDAAQLLAAYPDSESALVLALKIYAGAGRLEDLRQLGLARLERKAEDPWGLRFLARAAALGGQAEEAIAYLERLLATGKTVANDFNLRAWLSLFVDRADPKALEHAQRAVGIMGGKEAAPLHTLAAVYATAGKWNEAYTTLKQAVDASKDGKIQSHDWFVLGRMAEGYGLAGLARELYGRIPEGAPQEGKASTWHLARQRMARIP